MGAESRDGYLNIYAERVGFDGVLGIAGGGGFMGFGGGGLLLPLLSCHFWTCICVDSLLVNSLLCRTFFLLDFL